MMADIKDDFGIIITCSENDYLFAKGTCASIRTFMPDVKICLLIDGDFDLGNLPKIFDTKVIKKKDVKDEFLKKNSFGWGLTKMIAFWESPFEKFLLIDADTVVYGDVRKFADFERYDLILDMPQSEYSINDISQFYFNVDKIGTYYPDFNYRYQPFVCTGVIFAKRDVLDLDEYKRFFEIKSVDEEFYKCGEQGFLNICFFRAKDNNKVKIGNFNFQFLIPDYSKEDAMSKFPIPIVRPENPMVIHWAGKDKPLISNDDLQYVEPMTYFRRAYLELDGVSNKSIQDKILITEDLVRRRNVSANIFKRVFRKIITKLG